MHCINLNVQKGGGRGKEKRVLSVFLCPFDRTRKYILHHVYLLWNKLVGGWHAPIGRVLREYEVTLSFTQLNALQILS